MTDLIAASVIALVAFAYEFIDSSTGQGYGTLGTPTYVLIGYDPKLVVPAILLSQAVGGLTATYMHHFWKNADFHSSRDLKPMALIVTCGIVGVIIAAAIGVKLPKDLLAWYIGLMVLAIGIFVVAGRTFKFTWHRLGAIGAVSAFNKGLSGGGYGPLVTGGQIVLSTEDHRAVSITDFAEAPICVTGFAVWMILSYSPAIVPMAAPMALGAGLAALIGPWFTYKTRGSKLRRLIGVLCIILGIMAIFRILNP
jgi:uncharacterized membrane protein YfcA